LILYLTKDIGKFKVKVAKEKIKKINYNTKVKIYKIRLNNINFKKIINEYDYIIDGTDNFKTKFLLNDFCLKFRKILITGAISKFDGHVFTFDFKNNKTPCLRCFFQENEITEDTLNCESEGILGTVAGVVGTIQANEVLKKILNIGKGLEGYIFILDLLNFNFRKVKLKKRNNCFCK
jgi:adenylyltransferase/sulfurtransferase